MTDATQDADLAACRRRFEDGWPFIVSGCVLVVAAAADWAGLPDMLILAGLLFSGWISPPVLLFLRRHTSDARLGYVAEPPTPPSRPPTTREGMVTIVIVVLIGLSMMVRNATGRDPLESVWAWLGYGLGPSFAAITGVVTSRVKTEAGLPLPYASLTCAVVASLLTLWLAPAPLQFSMAFGATGLVLLLDGVVLLARTLRIPTASGAPHRP